MPLTTAPWPWLDSTESYVIGTSEIGSNGLLLTAAGAGCNSLESLNEFGNHHSLFPKRPPPSQSNLHVPQGRSSKVHCEGSEGGEREQRMREAVQEGLLTV